MNDAQEMDVASADSIELYLLVDKITVQQLMQFSKFRFQFLADQSELSYVVFFTLCFNHPCTIY